MTSQTLDTGPALAAAHAFRWVFGAVLSFSAMAIAGRELVLTFSTFEIMAYRSAIGTLIVGLLVWRYGGFGQLATKQPGWHIVRNVIHFSAQNCWFYAIGVIALAQVIAIEFTNPIWVLLLAPLLLGERMTLVRVVAAFLGFVGVLIVAQPGYSPIEWGHGAALGAAIGFALTAIATRRLTGNDSLLCILFWMVASQTVMGFAVAIPMGLTPLSVATAPWMVLAGISGLSAHFCLTRALQIAPAIVVAPMEFIRLPMLAVVGAVVYGEPLEAAVLIGGVVILSGNLVNILFRDRNRR